MTGFQRSVLLRYGASVPIVVLAIAARVGLEPLLGQTFPMATLFLAILVMAGAAGLGPAILTTILGGVGAAFFYFEPLGSLAINDTEHRTGLIVYGVVGTGIALLGGSMRATQQRAEANEAEANAHREQLRVTLASIGDAVIATDRQGKVEYANPVAEALTGWSAAEAAGQPVGLVFRTVSEKTREPAAAFIERVIAEGRVLSLDNRTLLIARDGTERAIEDSAAPIRDARGELIGVVVVFRDVTQQRRAEVALRQSEERLRYTLDSTRVGQWDLDLSTDIAVRSFRHDQIFGYDTPPSEWGFDLFLTRHVHPDDRVRVKERFDEATAGGRDWELECRIVRTDAAERWIWIKSGIYLTDHGQPLRMLGLVLDITDRKRAEEAAQAARDEAEEANRAKDRFLAILSHELRTPLNPILLTTTAMLDRTEPPADWNATLRMIRQNIDIQARLIDDLLDVMRIVRGKMPLHWEVADAHALIEKAVEICQSDVASKQLSLDLDLRAPGHFLNADPTRFQQVIWNLVKNAIKFTPAGGSITVRTRQTSAGKLLITVADTGMGIEPALLPLIFDPFQQGETRITRKFGGLGLGLAICRGIVEAHQGSLTATSPGPDQGTTFQVTLAPAPASVPARPPVEARPAAPPGTAASALKILMVEDDPTTRRVMTRLLCDLGHEVIACSMVAEAVAAAANLPLDLIISDIGLPDGTGLDLIRRITAQRGPIPAIALTGYGMEEDIQRSRQAGFTAHLTKPIDFAQLAAVIGQVAV